MHLKHLLVPIGKHRLSGLSVPQLLSHRHNTLVIHFESIGILSSGSFGKWSPAHACALFSHQTSLIEPKSKGKIIKVFKKAAAQHETKHVALLSGYFLSDSHFLPNASVQDVGFKGFLLHDFLSPLAQVQRNLCLVSTMEANLFSLFFLNLVSMSRILSLSLKLRPFAQS